MTNSSELITLLTFYFGLSLIPGMCAVRHSCPLYNKCGSAWLLERLDLALTKEALSTSMLEGG